MQCINPENYSLRWILFLAFNKLSWSHYTEILAISDDLARSFYEQQCIRDRWSVRELKRQKDSALFERVAISKDRAEILA